MDYSPHRGHQTEFLESTADFILGGGARGGGKSFLLAWKAAMTPVTWHYEAHAGKKIKEEEYHNLLKMHRKAHLIIDTLKIDYSDYVAIIIRKSYPQLLRNIKPECDKLYPELGAVWHERDHCYLFPSGAKVYLVHCQDERALDDFIGGNYNLVGIDEANQFKWEWIEKIATSCRSTNKLIKAQVVLTTNPGNIGHKALKERFVEKCKPIPQGPKIYSKEFDIYYQPCRTAQPHIDDEGVSWAYIPFTVWDNPTLLKNDPKYVKKLKNLNPVLRAMWLDGNWDVFSGMFFDQWNEMYHVVLQKSFRYGTHFTKHTHTLFRSYDYGTKAPFVCLFWAVDADHHAICFDEIVETGLSATKQAEKVNQYTLDNYGLKPNDFVEEIAGPEFWAKHGEKDGDIVSPADSYAALGIYLQKSKDDRKAGAKIVYDLLDIPRDEIPHLRFTDNCIYSIETFPNLPSKGNDPEDIDTRAEDHAYDAARYFAMKILITPTDDDPQKKGWRELLRDPETVESYNDDNTTWLAY